MNHRKPVSSRTFEVSNSLAARACAACSSCSDGTKRLFVEVLPVGTAVLELWEAGAVFSALECGTLEGGGCDRFF